MIKYIVKKWVKGQVNSALASVKDNEKVNHYREKVQKITEILSNVQEYLSDNEIDDDEIDMILAQIEEVI